MYDEQKHNRFIGTCRSNLTNVGMLCKYKIFLEIAYKGDKCYATKIKKIKLVSHQPTKCSWLTILSGTAVVGCTGWAREKGNQKSCKKQ